MNRNRRSQETRPGGRRGMMSMEIVLATAIAFSFAFGMYVVAQAASGRLYEFIGTMVGSPYL